MKRVLIVEDDKNISEMVYDLLKLNNYEPITAFDSSQALEKHGKTIDLILLDLICYCLKHLIIDYKIFHHMASPNLMRHLKILLYFYMHPNQKQ